MLRSSSYPSFYLFWRFASLIVGYGKKGLQQISYLNHLTREEEDEEDAADAKEAAEKKEKKLLSNFIDTKTRDAIVHSEVRSIRVAYLEETKNFISSAENFVPDKGTALDLLHDYGNAEMQYLKMLATDLMTTKEVKRPMFCLFTGEYQGKNWFSIIKKAIIEDMQKKKKKDRVIVFRPAKEIDNIIEKKAHERFERAHKKRADAARAERKEKLLRESKGKAKVEKKTTKKKTKKNTKGMR